ncbi:MAG: aspartate aminotransferase family protein [Alphaproteobacteria bacterium]
MPIPSRGRSEAQIAADLDAAAHRDMDWRTGGTFAYTYHGGDDVERVAKHAYMRFLTENGLDPTAYPSLVKFENELIEMARSHLSGDENVVGNFTSGGTESCLLAVKTARDYARAARPETTEPEVILPATAHAAFHKACHYFAVKPVIVPVDTKTFAAMPGAIAEAITSRTVLIVASAVSYAHGIMDPIPEIAAIAREHGLLFHVDSCIGGFQLPFWRKLGRPVPPFDFSVPGVTSMSMDFHKYAYCPKGASIILHRSKDLRRHQIFAGSNWTGYSIVNTTIQSSKSGGPLAAAWAVINYLGEEGYLRLGRKTIEATDRIVRGLRSIAGIEILGSPAMSLVAFASHKANPFSLIEDMRSQGWFLQPQLAFMGSPPNIHLTIRHDNLETADRMLSALEKSVAKLENAPALVPSGVLEQARSLTRETFTPETFKALMREADVSGGGAAANELLNAMSPRVRELVLVEFANRLYTPRA